jgi:NAD+ synthase (glutamine-hydrolysing)
LSGGVDSALVACLVYLAAGPERLVACTLPGRYSSEATRSIARRVADSLGVKLHTLPIDELVNVNERALGEFKPSEFNLENIQAKVRGTSILSNIAGITGGLMTCNGNKVEIAFGYATLYGDVNGGIAPIGDLLKTEVFAMAEYLNREVFGREVIPAQLLPDDNYAFAVPPSAELKPDQVDPMKWGYHDALVRLFTDYRKASAESVLAWYLDGSLCGRLGIAPDVLVRYGLDDPRVFVEDLEWVVAGMQRAVYKRIQAPPIIILSKGSYGYDIRESQLPVCHTSRYRLLRDQLLNTAVSGVKENGGAPARNGDR